MTVATLSRLVQKTHPYHNFSDLAVHDTEAKTLFDDTEDDSSASVDEIAITHPRHPAGQSLEIAVEDFDFDVRDEDKDAEPYKMDNGEREEANEIKVLTVTRRI